LKNKKAISNFKRTIPKLIFLLVIVVALSGLLNRFNWKIPKELEISQKKEEADFTVKGTLGKNMSLYSSLLTFGISKSEVYKITKALDKVFNLRMCKPNDSFLLGFASDSVPTSLEYKNGFERRFRVEKNETGWVADSVPLKRNCALRYIEGEINNSLWESMRDKCQNQGLIMDFTDIFEWEIDFLTEPRNGDKFRLIFEEYWQDGEFVKYGDILTAEYVFSQSGDKYAAFLYKDARGRKDYYDSLGHSLRKALLKSPLNYRRISSGFSYRRLHPIFRVYRPHLGVDYVAPIGTPVVAAGDGIVAFAGWKKGFGRYVEIKHPNGYVTCYGHLSRYGRGIKKGARIGQKDVVGYVGSSGYSTGPHLDYRVRTGSKYVNPLKMSLPPAAPIGRDSWEDFRKERDQLISALESFNQNILTSFSQETDST